MTFSVHVLHARHEIIRQIIAIYIDSASPNEVRLVEKTLQCGIIDKLPPKIIGGKAFDSKRLMCVLKTIMRDSFVA